MINEPKVEPVILPHEMEEARSRLTEIRFEAIVKMYDCGIRVSGGGFLTPERQHPPQWFKIFEKMSLEFIKHHSETEIGHVIKTMFKKLEEHIDNYEKQKP